MEKYIIVNSEEKNNYIEKDLIKFTEVFNSLNDTIDDTDDIRILRSVCIKYNNKYRVYEEKFQIFNTHYKELYDKLCYAYYNANMNDEEVKKILKSMAIQKAFIEEYGQTSDRLTSRDIFFLLESNIDEFCFNTLDDYYDWSKKDNCISEFIPAWNTLGYAISNKKIKNLKR